MNTLPKTALVALVAGTIGLTAAVPAFAQDAATPPANPPKPPAQHHRFDGNDGQARFMHRHNMPGQGHHRMPMAGPGAGPMGNPGMGPMARPGMGPMAMGGGLIDLACSPRGAEALEIAFVRLSYDIDLTDAQKPLLDDLKTTALDAQKDFADTCQAAMPKHGATPDPLAAYKARIAIESAHVDALNTVMPKFEAFIGSLDDSQKADLMPHRPDRPHPRMGGKAGARDARPGAATPAEPTPPVPPATTEPAPPAATQG